MINYKVKTIDIWRMYYTVHILIWIFWQFRGLPQKFRPGVKSTSIPEDSDRGPRSPEKYLERIKIFFVKDILSSVLIATIVLY
jgi:hypothetical protein